MQQGLGLGRAARVRTTRPSTMAPRCPRLPSSRAAAPAAAGRVAAHGAPSTPPGAAAAQKRDDQQQQQREQEVPSTLQGLLSTFFSHGSILGATAAIFAAASARLARAEPVSPSELALCLGAVALWCVCEWGIHRHLLHPLLGEDGHEAADEEEKEGITGAVAGGQRTTTTSEKRQRRKLGALREALRATHAEHHARPYLHVSVDGGPLIAAFMGATGACWCLAFWLLGGGGGGGGALSAAAAATAAAATAATATTATASGLSSPLLPSALASYWSAGLLYEFAHFAAHTRYVPKGDAWPARWLRGVRRHHLLHHCRSEAHWLSFTVPRVDALFGTLPDRARGGAWPAMTPMARRAAASWRKEGRGGGGP